MSDMDVSKAIDLAIYALNTILASKDKIKDDDLVEAAQLLDGIRQSAAESLKEQKKFPEGATACPNCKTDITSLQWSEHVLNTRYLIEWEDDTLIAEAESEVIYEDSEGDHIWCPGCQSRFFSPKKMDWR